MTSCLVDYISHVPAGCRILSNLLYDALQAAYTYQEQDCPLSMPPTSQVLRISCFQHFVISHITGPLPLIDNCNLPHRNTGSQRIADILLLGLWYPMQLLSVQPRCEDDLFCWNPRDELSGPDQVPNDFNQRFQQDGLQDQSRGEATLQLVKLPACIQYPWLLVHSKHC